MAATRCRLDASNCPEPIWDAGGRRMAIRTDMSPRPHAGRTRASAAPSPELVGEDERYDDVVAPSEERRTSIPAAATTATVTATMTLFCHIRSPCCGSRTHSVLLADACASDPGRVRYRRSMVLLGGLQTVAMRRDHSGTTRPQHSAASTAATNGMVARKRLGCEASCFPRGSRERRPLRRAATWTPGSRRGVASRRQRRR
jgi:hypothetical protein